MGTKTSKQQRNPIVTQDKNSYKNVRRAYAKWEHHSSPVSHDTLRFVSEENRNLKRHNQLSQNSVDQQKLIQLYPSSTKNFHHDQNVNEKKVNLEKSRSMEQLSNSNNLITAQQLIKNQSKRRQRYRSSSSLQLNDTLQNQNIQKSLTNQFIYSKNKTIQIPSDLQFLLINQLDLQNAYEIGKGNFGTVYRALYKGTRDVALKTLNSRRRDCPNGAKSSIEEYDDKSLYDLLHEAHIMTCLQHPNLLRIIGVTFFGNDKQLSLVTDFMKNGSLLDYLTKYRQIFIRSNSKDITFKLNSFSRQIFDAMLYLEERSIIHRDLAARNCLIGEENILKVGDFGLTKLTECGLYKGTYRTICALRWTSPEGIFYSKYTSRSDVWSYGITLWEIYSLGQRPYGNIDNKHLKYILKNSSENLSHYLPQSNQFGSDEIYTHLILPCLTYNVALRPRFKDLIQRIIKIFNQNN